MRADASVIDISKSRAGFRPGSRSVRLRKSRLRSMVLESLESRTLLATLPAAIVTKTLDISNTGGNQSSPSIAVDPTNQNNLASVWTRIDPNLPFPTVRVEGAFSSNAGLTWTAFNPSKILADPTKTAAPFAFDQATNASVDYDRNGNFYVVLSQHSTDNNTGKILLDKFSTAGGNVTNVVDNAVIYAWQSNVTPVNRALKPSLVVDSNVATFTDGGTTQTDPGAGDVYIAWASNDDTPTGAVNWNPNAIRMTASVTGGTSFLPIVTVNDGGNFGSQRDTAPRLTVSQGSAGVTGGQATIVWDDFGTLATATPTPLDRIMMDRVQAPTGGALSPGVDVSVTTTTVRGAQGITYPTISAASPLGIGPGAVLASDNTLGAFSPFEGRLYLAYVNRSTVTTPVANPADNTDVFLITSDDGGTNWSAPVMVNNDVATTDGFSEGSAGTSGRAQFEPSVAVDQGTGTVVVTFYDGRYDAARSRVATTIATSIDGGKTFGPETFANNPLQATDEATGQLTTLGPIPDNESAGNTATGADLTTFAFGDRQGLAVSHGHVYPAWSSNINGGTDGKQLLNIRVAAAEIAAGPRIISATMGPVGLAGDTLNNTTAADGTPIAKSFIVTFDRRVDPGTFTLSQAQVFFHDTVAGDAPVSVVVTAVTALNSNALGATQFRVDFTPGSQVGTYSFAVGPNIQDRIRSVSTTTTTNTLGQNTYNAVAPQVPQTIVDGPAVPNRVNSTIAVAGIPVGQVITGATVNLTLMYPFTGDLTLTLIAPDGTQVQLVAQQPAFAAGNGDPTSGFINTTFDDAAATSIDSAPGAPYTGTFKPERQLANLIGRNGNGTWTLRVDDNFPVFDSTGSLQSWSLTLENGTVTVTTTNTPGNAMDQNANATTGEVNGDVFAAPTPIGSTPFQAPYKSNTLPLIVPGPHVVSTSVPSGVSDPNAPGTPNTLRLNGTVSSLVVTFDRDMDPSTFTFDKVLRIEGPAGLISGPFTVTPVAGNARAFTIGFPSQQLSGTYTITLDSSIKSASGFALDTNLNAGVDVLRGTSSNAPVPLTFNSANVPVTITPGKTVESQITLTNDFVIQGLTLTLNISYPFDPDLTAALVAPDGTKITLFTQVGATGNNQNFTSTVFDDNATTAITNGGPPFFGRFKPQQPLGVLNNSSSIKGPGGTGTGVYTLEITDASTATTGTLNSWSLTLLKPTPTSGLGEPVADRPQLSFRIFTMDPANPVSSNTWTSVGPASIGGTRSGRIGGLAVDPSDPSGNTVYVAGASGGIWKTNNFLTTSAVGPTYIPLTDFGPTFGVNIGGIAVFGRNNDPNQSIIFVATGEGDTGSRGVGFLRSMDGGATWTLLDSTDNTLPGSARDHAFVGSNSFKILVDPRPTPTGDVIIYAALSGNNGGLWRSTDSGMHWGVVDPATGKRVANFAGQATDVVLDPSSGPIDAVSNPTGNLQVVYAAFRGDGVYISPNQGQVWNKLLGGVGDPLIQDGDVNPHVPITVNNLGGNPNGANGRIVLAKPDLFPSSDPNAALKNFIYEGWLYAAVVTTDNHLQGLYLTKDSGQNWTKLTLPTRPPVLGKPSGIPSNDTTLGNYDVLGNATFAQGNYDISLVSDPNNPEVVYLGGTSDGNPAGLIRVDVTAVSDPYAFFLANDRSDAGTLGVNSKVGVALKQNPVPGVIGYDPRSNPTINMTRNPANPFGNSTFYVNSTASFANDGSGVKWIPFGAALAGSTDQHRVIAIRDPLTGLTRLIFGDDQGVFSGVDNGDGTLSAGIGTALAPTGSRNGNLQITQFYYGASQPSTSAATQIAHALFYGSAQDDGAPHSTGDILSTGNLSWTGPGGDYGGVATDQTGTGDLYQYAWPCCGGNITDFFQVNGVGHTNGLIQASGSGNVPDPQWPFEGVLNFAVNPINGKQIVIDSAAGRVFRTEDKGANWRVLGDPAIFGGSNALALAFGAPDPALTGGSLDNFIYVGTQAGHIFTTFTGGGATGNNWFDITNGDLAGNTAPIQSIITNPTRTSHEAFAVTTDGVYHITDSNPASGATWKRITGNLFQITHNPFGDPNLQETQLKYLTSIQADWRYVLPGDPSVVGSPTHPALYVAGEGGVYESIDLGQTWSLFPSTLPNSLVTLPTPPGTGGGLPDAHVTDLSLALGSVDPTTGRAVLVAGDPNVLLASTYGRGSFAIRLAPLVIPNTFTTPVEGGPQNWLTIAPTIGFTTTHYQVTNVSNPVINGYSEQSAFGNSISVALYNLTASGSVVGPSTAIPLTGTLTTDGNGHFSLQIAAGYFTTSGYYTIGVQATDKAGSSGNVALLKILVELPRVPTPTSINLDPASDSGTFNNDNYTFDNNSAQHPAPIFDISGILPGATADLVRNGVLVGTAVNTSGVIATVQVADINGNNTVIPDSPVGTPIDTAPPAGNPYDYTAFQTDIYNFQSGQTAPPLLVIIDSTAPAPPTSLVLDPASDSGTKNNDNYTWDNNSAQHPAPVFDISGIEPNATVVLLRNGVIVNELTNTAGGTVKIADTNGAYNGMPGNGPIPDSPVGSPPDTAPPAGNPYIYTSFQIDLAGNPSGSAGGFGNTGAVVLDGTDSNLHGFADANGNEAGWFYMQKVLGAIEPNITSTQKILVALGPQFGVFGAGPGTAAMAITSAFNLSPLPSEGWKLEFVNGTANEDTYLSGLPAAAEDPTGASIGTVTLAKTGFMYITTSDETFDDLSDPDLVVLNKHGADIKAFVAGGGGLFTQTETPQGAPDVQNNPPGYGWLTTVFPGIGYYSLGSGGTSPTNIQFTPQGQAVFPTLTPADLSAGPWHGYFTGTFSGGLVPMFTDVYNGNTVVLALASLGGVQSNEVIIDSTPPAAPPITLDPGSDSGTYNNDQVTQDNNGNPYPAPVFDLTNVEPNAIVQLYRTPVVNGVLGTPVLVNTQTVPANSAIGPFSISDTNAGNGKIADGTYQYTAKQTDLAGNVGPLDTAITIVVDATAPVAPSQLNLDPASDTGTFNNDKVTKDNNSTAYGPPYFDASSIEAHANLLLYRAPVTNGVVGASVLVNTLVNVAGGALMIPDTNGGNGVIPDGTYQYSAKQIDLAGNISPLSNTITVIINTALPTPQPPPTPILDPVSDSGTFNNDQITQDNNGNPYPAPIFDIGSAASPIAATETVELFRAPVVNGVTGSPVLVNTLTNVKGGVIQIPDINAGRGRIPDGKYVYTDQLITLAGVPGTVSTGLTVIIDATVPIAPTPFRLDAASDTGVSNSDGITQITLIHFPLFDVSSVEVGATVNLYRNGVVVSTLTNTAGGLVQIQDHNQIPDGTYTYTVGQVDLAGNIGVLGGPITVIYDTAQPPTPPTPILDPASDTGIKGDNITSNTSPFFDGTFSLTGFEAGSSLSLARDGTVVSSTGYTVTSGAVTIQDLGPVALGIHTYQFILTDKAGNVSAIGGPLKVTIAVAGAGTLTLDPASDSGVKGDNITNVTVPSFDAVSLPANQTIRLLRDGVVVAALPTGGGGTVTITESGLLTNGQYTYTAVLVNGGVASPPGPALVITIDTSTPVTPTGLTLDPGSDTGIKGDNITSNTSPAIDVSSVAPGATVELLRNGSMVATLTSPSGGTVAITDPGPLFRGTYTYTAMQVSIAGNISKASLPLTVTIDTSTPATPTVVLDPVSDSGTKGDGITSVTNPYFDVSPIVAGATVTLFRNGVSVATLTSATAGTVKIQDAGPLALGSYTYTAQQTSVAGISSTVSSPLTITIVAPAAIPTVPTLTLASSADTGIKGDGITSARILTFTGTADPNVTVNLYNTTGTLLGTAAVGGNGIFTITVATTLNNGTYSYQAQAVNALKATSALSTPALQIKVVTTAGDYTDAGQASVALFRRVNAGLATWFVKGVPALMNFNFGAGALDVPMAADFNGDGKEDPSLYRPSTGQWFAALSGSANYARSPLVTFGGPADIPVPADYNGTGTDLESVFRPGTGQWFFYNGGNGHNITSPVVFPVNSQPEPGNYDGVGKAEIAVYNPATSQWLVVSPGAASTHVLATYGAPTDIPVPGQYDNIFLAAANKPQVTEPAVWRPTTGQFFIDGAAGKRILQFAVGDVPEPGDYEGIGQTEAAVYRPSTSQLLVWGPNDTSPRVLAFFGGKTDIPLLSPYPYRAITAGSGITASSVHGGSSGAGSGLIMFDFGGTSQAMTKSSGSTLGGSSASSLTMVTMPSTVSPPTSSITPVRPRQALIAKHKAIEHLKALEHAAKVKHNLFEKALHALGGAFKGKGHRSPRA